MSTTQESTVQVSTTLGSTYCTATLVLAAPPPLLSHTSQPQDRVLTCSGHKTSLGLQSSFPHALLGCLSSP